MGKHVHRATLDDLKHEARLTRRYLLNKWLYFTKPKLKRILAKYLNKHQ